MEKRYNREFLQFLYKKRKMDKVYSKLRDKKRRIAKSKKIKRTRRFWNEQTFYYFLKNTYFVNNKKVRLILNGDEAIVRIPKVFSLKDNPEETITVYNMLYQITKNKKINKVFFDHSSCTILELAASTIMDVFVMNLEEQRKIEGKKIYLHGKLPTDPYINTVLQVSGILKHLKINEEIDDIVENISSIEKLDLITGGKHSTTLKVETNTRSDNTSTKVSDYFNKCLNTQDYELTPEGYSYICHMVGEVIDNCQLHSGDFCQWFTLGNYFIFDQIDDYGECNLVIFNFGQTIYEGLKKHLQSVDYNIRDTRILQMKNSLEELTKLHEGQRFFGPTWDEEVLWTLYALQDGVSRCISEEEPDRGTGTVRLIEAFQEIGKTYYGKTPEMTLVSGKVQINFTEDYQLIKEKKNGEVRQIIAFNNKNDLKKPPDKKNVKLLKSYFPGTVISLKFYLDKKFIEKIMEED